MKFEIGHHLAATLSKKIDADERTAERKGGAKDREGKRGKKMLFKIMDLYLDFGEKMLRFATADQERGTLLGRARSALRELEDAAAAGNLSARDELAAILERLRAKTAN